jgi:hypothetical protein
VVLAPRRPLEASVNVDEIERQYGSAKRGPIHRFALWASGADRVVLDHARVEETEHVVQGTLVIFTAAVAAIAGMAAGSFLLYGHFVVTFASVAIGLLWGAGIFVLDRALVSSTYNPYRFSRDEVETLTELHGTAPWEHVLTRLQLSSRAQRARDMLRILSFGTLLRVALAIATSYIVAEMALFLIFEPEVNLRTQYLQNQERTQQLAEINQRYQQSTQQDSARRATLTGDNDPEVVRLTGELSDLTNASTTRDTTSVSCPRPPRRRSTVTLTPERFPTALWSRRRVGGATVPPRKASPPAATTRMRLSTTSPCGRSATRDALTKARDTFKANNAAQLALLDQKTAFDTKNATTSWPRSMTIPSRACCAARRRWTC